MTPRRVRDHTVPARSVAFALAVASALFFLLLATCEPSVTPVYGQTVPPPTPRPDLDPSFPSVAVLVSPSITTVWLGGEVQVTVAVETTPTCQFPIYDISLTQDSTKPLFAYISPTTETVGPPGPNPMVYTLQATRPGTTNFHAVVYGREICSGATMWQYVDGRSADVQVEDTPYRLRLPFVRNSGR
jgi:hypothetical protein